MPDPELVCPHCRNQLTAQDWTCPRCGTIADRFLFGTVTLESLECESRNAYRCGYEACTKQARQTGSWTIRPDGYRATPGHETAYRAGWQAASNRLEAKADRKFGRRRGVRVLSSGIAALSLCGAIAFATSNAVNHRAMEWVLEHLYVPIGLGAVNVVLGIVMMITGENDEARPL